MQNKMTIQRMFAALCATGCIALTACATSNNERLVRNLAEYEAAAQTLGPGDRIVLANGIWTDVELVLKAEGREDAPITLTAQDPGRAIITGQSNLALSGRHIVVDGLVFKDGYTPTSEVISFRTAKNELATHTRVTNTVIDSFSNPERHSADTWVAIYGKHNRFDHNTLVNKGNRGVTLAVRLNTPDSLENGHIIERNYFGPRQALGSNGGETLRIGTSHFSREFSNTVVRENYFDRTGGELEIISSKSCGNTISSNVFFESAGTLTMRHGHFTTVENNYFLGNRRPNTGGIRIINENQTVRNNYLYGLTGHRFRGALVIMNGVPDGPINRYDPVINSQLDGNVVIDSDHIQLCAGADEERSAPPTDTTMHNNVILTSTNVRPFTIYDDVSGISFKNNYVNTETPAQLNDGFRRTAYVVTENTHGVLAPAPELLEAISFGEVRLPVQRDDTGAAYYPKRDPKTAFRSGRTIDVRPGTNTLLTALTQSSPGDVLMLQNGGEYLLTKYAVAAHPVSIVAQGGPRPVIRSEKSSFFVISNGGSLELDGVHLDGAESPDLAGNNIISTDRYSMNQNYSLVVQNVTVTNLDVNHSFDFLKVYRSTFADEIRIDNSTMSNVTGSILALDKETDDLGIYNAENVTISNSTFTNVMGAVANLYRGGTDESTFGPIVRISQSTFENVGLGRRNRSTSSMLFHGVQDLEIADCRWRSSAPLTLFLTNGEPITRIKNVQMVDTPVIRANRDAYTTRNVTYE